MKIIFWGATDEVTGSMTFLEENKNVVMVDCGLCQGSPEKEEKNWIELPFDPKLITDVYITHAHLDHSGYLPRLVKKGFKGTIHCTKATAKLIKIILEDAAALSQATLNPLYEAIDVKNTLKLIKTYEWNTEFPLLNARAHFVPAGHILGAASLMIKGKKNIIFSGDLGRSDDLLMPEPTKCPPVDIVIMESTYGGKTRKGKPQEELKKFVEKVHQNKMVGLMASFALARGQMLMTMLNELFKNHPEFTVPVYFDSPMMKEVNKVYSKFSSLTHRPHDLIESLSDAESIDYEGQWNWLRKKTGPIIIISSSGMVSGGRIFRHLENWQTDANAILFLPGFQAEGTIGRNLLEGHRTFTTPEGTTITWCGEVMNSDAFSSHADQIELKEWLKFANPQKVFLMHGEEKSKVALKENLNQFNVTIARSGERVEI